MEKINYCGLYWLFGICLIINLNSKLHAQAKKSFTDVTEKAGIDHVFEVYEGTFGGGAVVFDFNKDGWEDIFITGGTSNNHLYQNLGDGTFKNVISGSGLERTNDFVTQGAVSADVNKDGWRDLFITTINMRQHPNEIPRAHNLLFLNMRNGSFRDVTKEYGLETLNSFSTGANFGDVNADGYPDLYVGNYFRAFEGTLGVIKDATVVSAHENAEGYLLINKNGKKYVNEYEKFGLNHKGFGFGGVFTDFDNDGDADLLVNQDFGYKAEPNFLYENKGSWSKFKSVGKELEMDLKINAMGAIVGDFDNNGLLDYYVTNIKFNPLMVNQGAGKPFIDKSKELGTYKFAISWGGNFADFDHDGDLDLFVANGDLNPNSTPMANYYFENQAYKFTENAALFGLNDFGIGRGSVVFDYDNDGDLDLLVVNQKPVQNFPTESKTKLYRNENQSGNWLKVSLQGVSSDRDGLGARVRIVIDTLSMIREIDGGGSSHLSQNSSIAHFGLADHTSIDTVIISWPSGQKQILTNIKPNKLLTVTEQPVKNGLFYYLIGLFVVVGLAFYLYKKSKTIAS